MPSHPCRWGQRRCRSAGPSGPSVITGRRSSRARSRASHTASVSTRVNVQTAYTSRPPSAVASAAAETIASRRAASPASASFGTRQETRAAGGPTRGRCRCVDQDPVERPRDRRRRGILDDEQRPASEPPGCLGDQTDPPRADVGCDDRPTGLDPLGGEQRLAPGRGTRVVDPFPGAGSSAATTNTDARSCTVHRPSAKPWERGGSPPPTSERHPGIDRPG